MSATTNLDDYNARALDFLARLGAQPAVAFHEHGVATAVRDALTEIGVSWRTDNFGNIIARIAGTDADQHPPIALMAHMDHPGFEIVGRDGDYLIGKALGGVPSGSFAAGVPLHIVLPGGRRISAETVGTPRRGAGASGADPVDRLRRRGRARTVAGGVRSARLQHRGRSHRHARR